MGMILRHHSGAARASACMLDELDWLLDMDTAGPRSVVKPLADQIRSDPTREELYHRDGVHDYLDAQEVDAVQSLRGWHRLRHGTVAVDARWLAEVRNVLDALIMAWTGCEEYAADLSPEAEADELALVQTAVDEGRWCDRCQRCQFGIMRDRIDAALDAQGFEGSPYYKAYVAATRDYDPEAVWRQRTMPAADALVAAVAGEVVSRG